MSQNFNYFIIIIFDCIISFIFHMYFIKTMMDSCECDIKKKKSVYHLPI